MFCAYIILPNHFDSVLQNIMLFFLTARVPFYGNDNINLTMIQLLAFDDEITKISAGMVFWHFSIGRHCFWKPSHWLNIEEGDEKILNYFACVRRYLRFRSSPPPSSFLLR